MKRRILTTPFLFIALTLQIGCQSQSDNVSVETPKPEDRVIEVAPVTGYLLPESLEVIPVKNNSAPIAQKKALSAQPIQTQNTDLTNHETRTEIAQKELESFDIIDGILSALRQAQYADARNINQGPYAAIIRFEEGDTSELEKWIIDSRMESIDGQDVNIVEVWINQERENIKAKFKIYAPASNSLPYGLWDLSARIEILEEQKVGQFVARVEQNQEGHSVITINESGFENEEEDLGTAGKLILSQNNGKGVMRYTRHLHREGSDEEVQIFSRYAYNDHHLVIETDIDDETEQVCKDRNDHVDITLDYRLYDSTGRDLNKVKQFGFSLVNPITNEYFWYGSWQTRHNLWGDNRENTLPEGTILRRLHRDGENQPIEEFFTGPSYDWFLMKKVNEPAQTNEIQDQVLNAWEGRNINLKYDAADGRFEKCSPSENNFCSQTIDAPVDLTEYTDNELQRRQGNFYGPVGQMQLNTAGTGFLNYDPQNGDMVFGHVWGPRYLRYTQGEWYEYDYQFTEPHNNNNWDVELGELSSTTLVEGYKYSMHAGDFEYHVTLDLSGHLQISRQRQDIIFPGQADHLANIEFTKRDRSEAEYYFNPQTLELKEIDSHETIEHDEWDLTGSDGHSYAWSYRQNPRDDWKSVNYLKNLENEFVFLDQAVYFEPIVVNQNHFLSGIGYDGHIRGLPDYRRQLEETNGELTEEIERRLINIPEQQVIDRFGQEVYTLKPRFIARVLKEINDEDICQVQVDPSLQLTGLPEYEDPQMGEAPVDVIIKVIEGEF